MTVGWYDSLRADLADDPGVTPAEARSDALAAVLVGVGVGIAVGAVWIYFGWAIHRGLRMARAVATTLLGLALMALAIGAVVIFTLAEWGSDEYVYFFESEFYESPDSAADAVDPYLWSVAAVSVLAGIVAVTFMWLPSARRTSTLAVTHGGWPLLLDRPSDPCRRSRRSRRYLRCRQVSELLDQW